MFALLLILIVLFIVYLPRKAEAREEQSEPAIVLAAFGTSDPEALKAIVNIKDRVSKAFPDSEVYLTFTSGVIRKIWRKRMDDAEFRSAHPEIDQSFYSILNPLSTLAAVQESGPRSVLVQSLHITEGAEYSDLKSIVTQLAGIQTQRPSMQPFPFIALGEPALGNGGLPYIKRAARALAPLAEEAKAAQAALVLMGHGNERLDMKVYVDLEEELRCVYGPQIYLGLVEGEPDLPKVVEAVKQGGLTSGKALLAPLMVVAGDHARKDMAGENENSWSNTFKAEGYSVLVRMEGLGWLESWADIYVERLKNLRMAMSK